MLKYLEAQLHPKALPAAALATPDSRTLPAAIAASHTIHAEVGGGDHIALNWFRDDKSGSYWHNGATGGYTAYAVFNPEKDFAVVVLCNTTGSAIADNLGKHIEQRLEGLAAVKLARELPKVVEVDPKVLDGYVGEYQLVPNFILTVTREGNRLITQATGQQKIEIFAESEKKFFAKVMDAQITFETDAEGRATGIILHQNGVDHEAKRVK
jgi:CubicO group peptidase (beta-lactamase class C family)